MLLLLMDKKFLKFHLNIYGMMINNNLIQIGLIFNLKKKYEN